MLWFIDGVSVNFFGGWGVEVVWGEELSELSIGLGWDDVDVVVRELWDVGVEPWESVVDWLGLEGLWGGEVDPSCSLVLEGVVPVAWCWFESFSLWLDVASLVLRAWYDGILLDVVVAGLDLDGNCAGK